MYQKGKRLKELPKELRPREKLTIYGAKALSDEELLAVVLGSGSKEMDVLSLSKALLELGWERLEAMGVREIELSFKGIGNAKACQIKAVVELVRRLREPYEGVVIKSPEEAYRFLKDKADSRREHLFALYLSPSAKLMDFQTIAVGRLNAVYAEPKDVLYYAIKSGCYSIIVAHNHPKGELKPSREDIEFTSRLKSACAMMGFELLDHIVFNEKGYVSMKREGLL
ncbi:MAG: JAB domain-containing protein [Aquificota bacterium]|nr:MAG: JAB domain-containing protein [Aquificota bacterium]